jgi:Ni/Co efflux regulator RcnB
VAQDRGNDGRRDRGAERAERRAERVEQTADRPERAERVERQRQQVSERANWSERGEARQRAVESQAREPAFQQPAIRQQGERRAWDQRRRERTAAIQPQVVSPVVNNDGDGSAQRYRSMRVRDGSTIRRFGDQTRSGAYTGDRTGTSRGERSGVYSRDRAGSRYSGSNNWSNQWRSDRRYDWRRHRDGNRSIYRLGHYRDPYGSRYRRFTIGFSLFPSYYQSNYWLDDPYMYRLPIAYGPYRWVRYYDDALLVNIYSGQVVDVVYGVFW